jgi:GH35 family endo-1,4-beta-xylanase
MIKIFTFKLTFTILFLFAFGIVHAQIPTGGTILNATSGTTYQKIGKGTLAQVNVEGQSFTKALRYITGTDIINFWDSQIQFPSVAGIAANDVVLVAFYARTISSVQETGEGSVAVIIEHKTTYDKEISTKLMIGREWKQYYASVKTKVTWSAADTRYALFTGFPSQTIEIADVQFINYKNSLALSDLPVTEITYFGQAPDAEWRVPAQERINQFRKGNVDITVYNEQGQPVENAEVSIEMTRHKFGFGTAIPANVFITNTVFRKKVYELFNEVVFENDLKWPQFNINNTLNIRRSLDSLDRHKIAVRGHNVIWPSWKFLPSTLKTLESNPVALRVAIDKRIDEVTQFTKGRLNDWDVINEPYSEKDVMAILGDEVMADWFKRVRNNDRTVKLYLNDYSILSGGGQDTKKQDYYFNLVKYIDEKGGRVDGIGFQGHFGSDLTSPTKVYSIIERFATLGKEIKITEHDINVSQRQVQADYTRDFLTICFSHESVKSFLFWGFWANSHWLPDGALFNSDWTIRPHGEAYKDLVFNQWWTKKTDSITNVMGKTTFEGFLGTYKYAIKSGDKIRMGTFEINNSKKSGVANPVILSFDTAIPDNVEIKASKPTCLCEGENITLQTVTGEGLAYQWFRGDEVLPGETASITTSEAGFYSVKVKKGAVEINSPPFEVKVNPIPEAVITATGDLSFCPGGKVKLNAAVSKDVSYNWMKGILKINGSVSSIDVEQSGSYTLVASANGCSSKSETVNVQVYSTTDPACTTGINDNEISWRVFPNPFKGSFVLETGFQTAEIIKAELFNATGALVKNIELDQYTGKTIIDVVNPGFYTLRISSGNEVKIFKLIGN